MKKSIVLLLSLVIIIFCTSGCATQSFRNLDELPGFFHGLFHGFIILFSFIGSFFTDYDIYAFPNNGGWYDFGFLLGVMSFFGGGGSQAKRRRRK